MRKFTHQEKKIARAMAQSIKEKLIRRKEQQTVELLKRIRTSAEELELTAQTLLSTSPAICWGRKRKQRELMQSLVSGLSGLRSASFPPHPYATVERENSPHLREALLREGVETVRILAAGEIEEELYTLDNRPNSVEEDRTAAVRLLAPMNFDQKSSKR